MHPRIPSNTSNKSKHGRGCGPPDKGYESGNGEGKRLAASKKAHTTTLIRCTSWARQQLKQSSNAKAKLATSRQQLSPLQWQQEEEELRQQSKTEVGTLFLLYNTRAGLHVATHVAP